MSFLILSPPRCMSAWLANLLTEGDIICHHDAMAFGGLGTLQRLAAPTVGFAETGAVYALPEILEMFPDTPMVLVLADLQRVAASLRGIGVDGEAFIEDFAPRVARAAELLAGRALFVRDVEVAERAGDIAEFLTGRRPAPARLELLRSLTVTKREPLRCDIAAVRELIERAG